MSHNHSHNTKDGHNHDHGEVNYNKAFIIGSLLNISFILIELWFGYSSKSLSLVSDAIHNTTDVFGLFISWAGIWFATRKPTNKRTYGFGRGSILTSLINAIIILVAAGGIFVEGIHRLGSPVSVMGSTVVWVAIIGILINGITALLFLQGRKNDINIRGAFVHMAVDALVSLGVVVAGLLITLTGFAWIDPIVSIIIAGIIVLTTWSLMKDSLNLALDAVPEHVNRDEIKKYLETLPGVCAVHDLHIWAISTKETGLTAHLVHGDITIAENVVQKATKELESKFSIGHVTLQVERDTSGRFCRIEPDHII